MKFDLEKIKAESHKRFFQVGSFDPEKRTVELSFSSEIKLERYPGFFEILSHDAGACDLSRLNNSAPLLFNHDSDEVIGVVELAEIGADRKGRAVVRFSKNESGESVFRDIQDGILKNVSVGYLINDIKLTEENEQGEFFTVRSWQPYEISIVSIPADTSVGIGRSINLNPTKKDTPMNSEITDVTPAAPVIDVVAERKNAQETERTRTRSILEAGKQFNASELAQEFALSGRSLEEFRKELLESKHKQSEEVSPLIGLSQKEARSFSFTKLISSLASQDSSDAKRNREKAAFEHEVCEAGSKMFPRKEQRGVFIPFDVVGVRGTNITSVKTASGYAGTGGMTVPTTLLGGSFIDTLRNQSWVMQRAMTLAGLVGDVQIPKKLTNSVASWIGEDETAARSDITFGQVTLAQKTVSCRAEMTRKLMMQSSIDVEALVREDLALSLALEMDHKAIYGSGSSNQPTGVKNVSGILSLDLAATNPTYAELVGMETLVDSSNALVNTMAYVGNPKLRGHLKTTQKFSGTNGMPIWEQGDTVNGYNAVITNQLADGDVFFGNWNDLLVGLWGGIEIMVDPYSGSDTGRLKVVMFQDVDFAIRRGQSFVWGSSSVA